MNETIWGLDLGTTSIGFAVVEQDAESDSGKILPSGKLKSSCGMITYTFNPNPEIEYECDNES